MYHRLRVKTTVLPHVRPATYVIPATASSPHPRHPRTHVIPEAPGIQLDSHFRLNDGNPWE
jgi:hypothetical protein